VDLQKKKRVGLDKVGGTSRGFVKEKESRVR